MAPSREQIEAARQESLSALTASLYGQAPPEPTPVSESFAADPFAAILGADLQAMAADPRADRITSPDRAERARALAALSAKAEADAKIKQELARAKEAEAEPSAYYGLDEDHEASLARLEVEAAQERLSLQELISMDEAGLL